MLPAHGLDNQRLHRLLTNDCRFMMAGTAACEVLGRVECRRIHSSAELLTSLHELLNAGSEGDGRSSGHNTRQKCRLLVVDSVPAIFSTIQGRKARGNAVISLLGQILSSIAVQHSAVVITTNYVLAASDRPALGSAWAHVPSTRLLLTRSSDYLPNSSVHVSTATVLTSNRLPAGDTATVAFSGSK